MVASSQASQINERTVRNKIVQVGKIRKINKRTCTTIPHLRVLQKHGKFKLSPDMDGSKQNLVLIASVSPVKMDFYNVYFMNEETSNVYFQDGEKILVLRYNRILRVQKVAGCVKLPRYDS